MNEPNIPRRMTVVEITRPGGPEVLVPTQRPTPVPGPREVLIRVFAAGVNGPDVLQRKGLYDPPAGASDIPGLEISGEVVARGRDTSRFAVGDKVCALIPGGGYADYAVADERTTLHLPEGLDMVEAAALPETFMTVWDGLFQRGGFKRGETVLIHGGASGIGITATMLAKAFGAGTIITTVANAEQRQASLALGADVAVNYQEADFVEEVMKATDGKGVDVIVDIIAGDYVGRNYQAAAMSGRIVQIGVIKGAARDLARGQGARAKHRRGARRSPTAPVRLRHPGDDGLAGTRQGVGTAPQGPGPRRPGVVCPAHVLSAPDAGLAPAGPHHDPLVLCAVVPARHRQDQPGQRGRRTPPRSGGRRGSRRARGTGGGPTRGSHRRPSVHDGRKLARRHSERTRSAFPGGVPPRGRAGSWGRRSPTRRRS